MMNVKKYRATTTREALQQIKQDLGEDAFVLETKQIRTGGFLGFKSESQIEISAAAPAAFDKQADQNQTKQNKPASRKLHLTDDTPAAPQPFEADENSFESAAAAPTLNSRLAMSGKFENAVSSASHTSENRVNKLRPEIESVEISSEAPRFVHQKKELVRQPVSEQLTPTTDAIESFSTAVTSREFELLRAELREVKFSLGAFAGQQNAQTWENGISMDDFVEVFEAPFYDSYLELTAASISPETARKIIADIIPYYKEGSITAAQITHKALINALSAQIKFEQNPLGSEKPAIMAVIGATGVGKTTTIAKLAARFALHEHRRVELVTLDTYRIAAVEQLKTYAEIIGANCQVVNSVFELDATLRRMPAEATVLIDTTGRNPLDLADQYEFSDYLKQHTEIRKCLAVQSTVHPFDSLAAIKKFEMYGADCLALTKIDETTRPGALFELVVGSRLPLAYCCMGQRVPEDLLSATPENFAAQILRRKI